MYVGQITLEQERHCEREAASNAIGNLLYALRISGQICGKEWPVAMKPESYVATVLLPEQNSLDAVYQSRHVRQALQELRDAGFAEPDYEVNEDLEGEKSCDCARPSSYILYTTFLSTEAPLRCGDCFRVVALYRVPPRGEHYQDYLSWQAYYQECDALQMGSGSMERPALRQVSQWNSDLSTFGLDLCHDLYEATQIPTYYYLHRMEVGSLRKERKRLCPSCKGEWLLPTPWHLFDFRCERCHLLSNIAWNARS